MSNNDVNVVILRMALTLQRCGEDPRAVFAALIGAAATIASDIGHEVSGSADLRRAIDSVVDSGHLAGFHELRSMRADAVVVPFPSSKVA